MHDRLPDDEARFQRLVSSVFRLFAQAGYRPISVPILEPAELFMLKSGEEIVSKIYAFEFRNQHLCLRPEITASVIRAYIEHMAHQAAPVRLCYWGPVFRYEPLEAAKFRQFNQVGVELIGAKGPFADAEVLQLALDTMTSLGIAFRRVVIGHTGVAASYLRTLPLEERLRTTLLWHVEQLRDQGREAVLERVATLCGFSSEEPNQPLSSSLGEDEARKLLAWFIDELGIDLTGSNRSPEDIFAGLLARLTRPAQRPIVEQAMDFLSRLATVAGPPEQAISAARRLLQEVGLASEPLDDLERVVALTEFPPGHEVIVDFAMSRGLHYYTGPVFELFADGPEGELRVGGGGRYDGLVGILGGDPATPACGFALHAERLLELADRSTAHDTPPRKLAVVPQNGGAALALRTARLARRTLPGSEIVVVHQEGEAGVRNALDQGYRAVLLVGGSPFGGAQLVLFWQDGSQSPVRDLDDLARLWAETEA